MDKVNLIDKLHESDLIYFVLGSLISSEILVDIELCKKSLKTLEMMKEAFETSKLKDNTKTRTFLEDAERIIKRDLKEFEEAES